MNKTQKIILIAAIAVVLGLMLLIAATVAVGGNVLQYLANEGFFWGRNWDGDHEYSLRYHNGGLRYDGGGQGRIILREDDYEYLGLSIDQDFDSIRLDNDFRDVRLFRSEDDQVIFRYPEGPDETYLAQVNAQGVLEIQGKFSQRLLQDSFNFENRQQYALELYLPEKWRGDISLSSDFGDVSVNGVSCRQLYVNSDYGDLMLRDTACTQLELHLDCGEATVSDLAASQLKAQLSMGDLELRNAAAAQAELKLDCGELQLKNVNCPELWARLSMGNMEINGLQADQAQLSLNAGNLEFADMDAQRLEIDCDMGNVCGQLAGSWQDYEIHSDCELGRNNLSQRSQGERYLNVNVDAGNIEVEFDAD